MNWISLWKGIMSPISTGIDEHDIYTIAKTEEEAIKKVRKCISGNYEVSKMIKVAELYDFGTDVYTPENF